MTVYSPSNAAEIITAINESAIANGNIVELPAGDWDCTATPLAPSNAGVTLRGPGSSLCTIKAIFTADMDNSANAIDLEGFALDLAGLAGECGLIDGIFNATDFKVVGVNTLADLLAISSATGPTTANLYRCIIGNGFGDTFNIDGNNDYGPASKTCLHDCYMYGGGDGGSDQVVTTHNDHRLYIYGGIYDDSARSSATFVFANGSGADGQTPSYVHSAKVIGRIGSSINMYDCDVTDRPGISSLVDYSGGASVAEMKRCTFHESTCSYFLLIRGAAINSYGSCHFNGNGFGVTSITGCDGANFSFNNDRFSGFSNAIRMDHNAGAMTLSIKNCITDSNVTNSIVDSMAGGSATITGNNNVFGTVQTGSLYTLAATDVIGVAEIDAEGVPKKGGNCDVGKGDPTVRPTLGDLDIHGRPKLSTRDCIGPVYSQRRDRRNLLRATHMRASEAA